jgi:hypothetical protein
MGTSSSYGGPSDRTPLLPAWALPPAPTPPPEVPHPQDPPEDDGEIGNDDGASETPNTDAEPVAANPAENLRPAAVPPGVGSTGTWTSAKIGFRKAIESRTPQSFRNAAKAYARASRSLGSGAAGARSGKQATASLGGFLSAAAGQGLQRALDGIGLAAVVGRDVNEVLAALSNALAPDGATKEEAAARDAVNEAIESLYEGLLAEGRDLTALETMSPADIAASVALCVESYIYNRWLGDLGVRIEQKAVSAAEAVRIERDVRAFIHETVRLDMSRVDVMTLDWRGEAGRQFVETIYRDAYTLFGGEP